MNGIVRKVGVFLLAVAAFPMAVHGADTPPPAKEGKPVAVVEEKVYTFPDVPEGKDVSHAFVIKNTGNAELVIKKVHPG